MTDEDDTGSAEDRARLVGINHTALEVGDVDEAIEFYGSIFEFPLRGRSETAVFLDMGDQFLALMETDGADGRDGHRHVGLVVDDSRAVEDRLDALDVSRLDTDGIDFHDPWGNRIQVVVYGEIQFTKAGSVLAGMDLALEKSEAALEELGAKGMAPD
ncbi:VOC family protein [Saliphagus infecundisoli]|uniref:VOC family protein n=1 Tax=Saliphagus infecundisoli TaxID=1849069 RepID=A0ABD5QKC9_9EURY|nr:VOC family protein [Saliphagus infecundisoli]